ncbi:hypothetical protein MLD52_13490 [Puniceicoccaceae bacterium K14]|nr:hypothetical protein [Puniceicoccaceae bacterium K14]
MYTTHNSLRIPILHLRLIILSALVLVLSISTLNAQAEFVILANKDSPIESIGKTDLARLYLSKTKKIDGQAYRVVNLAAEDVKQEFLEDLTSMSPAEIERHYIAQELRGEGEKPKEVNTTKNMIFLLIKSDAIIGWLPMEEYEKLSGALKKHMRVIRIK